MSGRFQLDDVASAQIHASCRRRHTAHREKDDEYTAHVDKTCVCVGKESYIEVTLNVEQESDDVVEVVIKGDGPTFKDGTKKKTLECKTQVKRFDIKAGNKPGCFTVCVGTKTFKKAIRVVRATGTFRGGPGQEFSKDNRAKRVLGARDKKLGVGRPPLINSLVRWECWRLAERDASVNRTTDYTSGGSRSSFLIIRTSWTVTEPWPMYASASAEPS